MEQQLYLRKSCHLNEHLLRHSNLRVSSYGKIITNKEVDDSNKFDNKKPIYLFTLNKKYTLDGDFSWNIAGLVNHSCNNNCDYNGKGLKVWITAIRDIKKGEEFTCDYGFGYDEDYKQFPCKCGSKNCCGYIVREESRWRINKKFAKKWPNIVKKKDPPKDWKKYENEKNKYEKYFFNDCIYELSPN